jgi:hypothetical protein
MSARSVDRRRHAPNADAPQFVCYALNPAAHLAAFDAAVLRELRNARGFFLRHGFTASAVSALLKRQATAATPRAVAASFEMLERRGLATCTDDRAISRYKAVCRG